MKHGPPMQRSIHPQSKYCRRGVELYKFECSAAEEQAGRPARAYKFPT